MLSLSMQRSSQQRCSIIKRVLRNFAKFTRKHLCQSLFFNKVADEACNFIKKETLAQVFSCEFCEIFENIFFTEHLRTTAPGCKTNYSSEKWKNDKISVYCFPKDETEKKWIQALSNMLI